MNTSFPSNSKIWIFQSVEYLDLNDCYFIKEKMIEFIQSWDSHGKILKAEYDILYSHFILVTCDSMINEPSGCAIDKLFNQIREIGLKLDVDFFRRNLVAYKLASEKKIKFLSITEFKKIIINTSKSDNELIIFDNSISRFEELKNWKINLDSWKQKYGK